MVESYRRRSALAHFGLAARAADGGQDNAEIVLAEEPHRSLINIRGDASDSEFRSAVLETAGVELPVQANSVSVAGARRILWLGPNEWLLSAPDGEAEGLIDGLRQAFGTRHTSVVDVSESRVIISIAGPGVRDFLARGISLDLHPKVFRGGQCAQTGMSRCNVLLHLLDEEKPLFEIYVLKSFSDYLWRWIHLAGQDFKIAIKAA